MELIDIAKEAIHDAYRILEKLAELDDISWINQSTYRQDIDRLARRIGYPDAKAVAVDVEADRYELGELWDGYYDL